jgi:hypothetical protein
LATGYSFWRDKLVEERERERERDRERRGTSKRVGAIMGLGKERERWSRECRGMPKFQSPTHPFCLTGGSGGGDDGEGGRSQVSIIFA